MPRGAVCHVRVFSADRGSSRRRAVQRGHWDGDVCAAITPQCLVPGRAPAVSQLVVVQSTALWHSRHWLSRARRRARCDGRRSGVLCSSATGRVRPSTKRHHRSLFHWTSLTLCTWTDEINLHLQDVVWVSSSWVSCVCRDSVGRWLSCDDDGGVLWLFRGKWCCASGDDHHHRLCLRCSCDHSHHHHRGPSLSTLPF